MAETLLNQQESKPVSSLENKRQQSHMKRTVGIILSIVMLALTAYVINLQHQNNTTLSKSTEIALMSNDHAAMNYRAYVVRYKETKIELDETTRKLEQVNLQLNQVTADLATTKGMLNQTQGMLVQAQDENIKLKQELQGLDGLRNNVNADNINELQAKIKLMKDNDAQISGQLADLKNQLRAFNADFSSPDEGQSLITLFREKINLVKSRMHYLRQEAFYTKVAAQKEKDRLALLNGNIGYVLRNGQPQNPDGTKKTFAINVNIVQ